MNAVVVIGVGDPPEAAQSAERLAVSASPGRCFSSPLQGLWNGQLDLRASICTGVTNLARTRPSEGPRT